MFVFFEFILNKFGWLPKAERIYALGVFQFAAQTRIGKALATEYQKFVESIVSVKTDLPDFDPVAFVHTHQDFGFAFNGVGNNLFLYFGMQVSLADIVFLHVPLDAFEQIAGYVNFSLVQFQVFDKRLGPAFGNALEFYSGKRGHFFEFDNQIGFGVVDGLDIDFHVFEFARSPKPVDNVGGHRAGYFDHIALRHADKSSYGARVIVGKSFETNFVDHIKFGCGLLGPEPGCQA